MPSVAPRTTRAGTEPPAGARSTPIRHSRGARARLVAVVAVAFGGLALLTGCGHLSTHAGPHTTTVVQVVVPGSTTDESEAPRSSTSSAPQPAVVPAASGGSSGSRGYTCRPDEDICRFPDGSEVPNSYRCGVRCGETPTSADVQTAYGCAAGWITDARTCEGYGVEVSVSTRQEGPRPAPRPAPAPVAPSPTPPQPSAPRSQAQSPTPAQSPSTAGTGTGTGTTGRVDEVSDTTSGN